MNCLHKLNNVIFKGGIFMSELIKLNKVFEVKKGNRISKWKVIKHPYPHHLLLLLLIFLFIFLYKFDKEVIHIEDNL